MVEVVSPEEARKQILSQPLTIYMMLRRKSFRLIFDFLPEILHENLQNSDRTMQLQPILGLHESDPSRLLPPQGLGTRLRTSSKEVVQTS